jgi:selenocysteine-specific translation elongation factor
VHGLLHLLGFDHEVSKVAEEEMEKEEEHILNTLEWRGKGLIKSAYDIATGMEHLRNSVGKLPLHVLTIIIGKKMYVNLFLVTYLWIHSQRLIAV